MKTLRPYQQKAAKAIKDRLKAVTHPLLVTASVGAGKSLIIADILLWIEKAGYKALCLTLNSTLIQQNADTYKSQGGHCGIYVGSLNTYEVEPLVIFGSPQSVCNGIRDKNGISKCGFNLIVVDECHNISPHDTNTMYQRIINHYGLLAQSEQYSYRIIGLTGTPYRGKGHSIVGPDEFFKEEVCNIPANWLISRGYLTKPAFGITEEQGYDFSKIRVNSMGKFSGSELERVIASNERLTGSIMRELQKVMKNHRGAFIFCCTKRHCEEALRSLPAVEAAIITGETPHEKRKEILDDAKQGKIKYLISVGCLNVGVDVPSYDVCAWLRPTESLILYTQGIGRVLRLYPDKPNALILDFAGNLERHGDIDDPIINEALQPKAENEKDYIIPCLSCKTLNTLDTRRCIGVCGGKRCDNYFQWKDCHECNIRNDTSSRMCRGCGAELIDPNARLSLAPIKPKRESFNVKSMKAWVLNDSYLSFNVIYILQNGLRVYESFVIRESRSANIFYGAFVRVMVDKPSRYYKVLTSELHLRQMTNELNCPSKIECKHENGRYKVVKRLFVDIVA